VGGSLGGASSAPPPSLALTPAALASLAALFPGKALRLQVVQFGVSPVSETAGVAALQYPPPRAVSDAAIEAEGSAAAAVVAASGGGGRGGRQLQAGAAGSSLSAAMNVAIASSGGTSASSASQASLLAAAPRAALVPDLLPARPLDSRTVSISAALPDGSAAAAPAGAGAGALPTMQLVIPLRDLSRVAWDARAQRVAGVDVGQALFFTPALNITCPASPAAAAAGQFNAVYTTTASGAPGGARGAAALVRLVAASRTAYSGVVGAQVEQPTASATGGSSHED
jgi:hypothetical protein